MKAQILILISMLASCTFARPQAKPFESNDPISQRSQVTAFVVTDDGVKVECWEIDDLLPESTPYDRRYDSKAPRVMRMANGDLQGVDLLTWPEPSELWPAEKNSIHSQWLDLSAFNNLFSINGGLINFNVNLRFGLNNDDDDDGSFIFSAENGDNWFYFEDETSGSSTQQCANSKRNGPPLTIQTRSATDTTLTHFKYKSTPTHKVLHSGRCRFSGLVSDSSNNRHRLTTQEL